MTQTVHSLANEAYVSQITHTLNQHDKEKLQILLDHFLERDEKTRARVLFEISVSDAEDAYFALNHLVSRIPSETPHRVNLIELLLDRSRTHAQFILPFIEHASLDQLKEAIPVFASILLNETDSHILQKTLMAIGKTGEKSCINVVADFIFYDHAELKREAIIALGRIGGPSAVKRLSFASQTSKSDDFLVETLDMLMKKLSLDDRLDNLDSKQFASRKDTLEGLAEDSDIAQLIFMLNSPSPHDRHLAIDSLIEIGPQVIPAVSGNIDITNSDSMINGLDILGNIRNEATLPAILKILSIRHSDSNVRFAAYEAISMLPHVQSSVALIEGITDESEQVRLAAATAIDNNLSSVMTAGLKSKIETSGRQSKRASIIAAIIDSHSGHIFSNLLDSDAFVFNALEYLAQSHHSTVSFFKDILVRRGTLSLANSIEHQAPKKPAKDRKSATIFCVDDSSICLKYYIRFFHSLGHIPHVFDNAQDVLDALEMTKPDLLTMDLNMLSMNGLQLAEKVRERYSLSELPIAIISTQEDFYASFHERQAKTKQTNVPLDLINFSVLKPLMLKSIKPIIDHIS